MRGMFGGGGQCGVQPRPGRCSAVRMICRGRLGARFALTMLGAILAGCGDGGGEPTLPEAAIRTLAYVVTECHDRPEGSVGRQRLEILRGDAPAPLVIKDLDAFGPIQRRFEGFPLCITAAFNRLGAVFVNEGVFQRLGVSPDGSRVAFEVTDTFATVRPDGEPVHPLPEDEKGIFVVHSDGSDLRRLGPASRDAPFRSPNGFGITSFSPLFDFNRDSKTVVYTDLGPGPEGEEAIQIVSLDVETGRRTQLTRLPSGPPFDPDRPSTLGPFFLDANRVAFYSTSNPENLNPDQRLLPFTVNRDGTNLKRGPQPVGLTGGGFVPEFVITGPTPGTALISPSGKLITGDHDLAILEVFVVDGDNLLQLTNFGLDDTLFALTSADGQRVIFNSSADPCVDGSYPKCSASNPNRNCQLFSIDRTGGDLRQLTAFEDTVADPKLQQMGCTYNAWRVDRRGCSADFFFEDLQTETFVFHSSCNPFGPPSFVGAQIYAMRPDGSGLRALTALRGIFTDSDGFLATELPLPVGYSTSTHYAIR